MAPRHWLLADSLATDDRGWAYNLAIFRIVFLGGAVLPFAWGVVRWAERILPGLPPEAWKPVSFFAFLPLEILANAPLAFALALVNLGLIALGVLGVFTPWTLGLATVLSLYVFGLPQNQGKIDHYHHVIWFMALLAIGPSARFLSIDAVRTAIRDADRGVVAEDSEGRHGFAGVPRAANGGFGGRPEPPKSDGAALSTFRYIWLLFGLLYLPPGLAKLEKALTSGWASADNLRTILWDGWWARSLYSTGFHAPTWLTELPAPVLELAGIGVILFEVAFIVVVFIRPARPWLAFAGLAFHRGSRFALGIAFSFLTPAYVGLFDWSAIGRALRRRTVGEPLVVLYDGDCRLCRRAIALVRSLDLCDAIEPIAAGDPRRRNYPALTDEMLAHDLYVVAGTETAAGYDAYVRIASRIPFLWPLALLMRVPLVAGVGRRLYRRVADSRACAVASPAPVVAHAPRRATPWLTAIGLGLVIGQATVSGAQLVTSVAGDRKSLEWWSRIAWPFDHYPRFTDARRLKWIETWEPRAVFADGRETRISPEAFQRAFGSPSRSMRFTTDVMRVADPTTQRKRALHLLQLLWSRERPEVRARAVEIRVYAARYRFGRGLPTIAEERLLHRFALDELRAPSRAGGRPTAP